MNEETLQSLLSVHRQQLDDIYTLVGAYSLPDRNDEGEFVSSFENTLARITNLLETEWMYEGLT